MAHIELRISRAELTQANATMDDYDGMATPARTQRYVVGRMRKAGIPVIGLAFLLDIERGTLTVRKETDTGGWHITWRD